MLAGWFGRLPIATILALAGMLLAAACSSLGPAALQDTRLQYNEAVKVTT